METVFIILIVLFILITVLLVKNIYEFTIYDARSRNIEKPRLWGILNNSGNNSILNTLFYLIKRKNYPIENLENKNIIEKYRKNIIILLILSIVIGLAIFLIIFTS